VGGKKGGCMQSEKTSKRNCAKRLNLKTIIQPHDNVHMSSLKSIIGIDIK
jgi:hypothetical protein